MLNKIKISEYIYYKSLAYRLVPMFRTLSFKEKIDFLENYKQIKNEELFKIFIYTLFFPNDIETFIHLINKSTAELHMPKNVLDMKKTEFISFKIHKLLKTDKLDKNYANQLPVSFEADENEIISLMNVVFPDQPYQLFERREKEREKENIKRFFK